MTYNGVSGMSPGQMKDGLLLLREILVKESPNTKMAVAMIHLWLDSHWPGWENEAVEIADKNIENTYRGLDKPDKA